MYKKKLEPLEILEKIKLSMNYDMGKTLNENRGVIVELDVLPKKNVFNSNPKPSTNAETNARIESDNANIKATKAAASDKADNSPYGMLKKKFLFCSSKEVSKYESRLSEDQIENIVKTVYDSMLGWVKVTMNMGTDMDEIVKQFKKIPTKKDFCKVANTYKNTHAESLLVALDGDIDGSDFQEINGALYHAFKYNTPEESNKKAPKKSTIDKSSSKPLELKLKDSVYRQIEIEKGMKNARGFLYAASMTAINYTIETMSDDAVYTLKNNARADDIMNKYIEAKRTNQTLMVGDKVLNNYLNKMLISLSGNGGDFISLFEHLVNVRKGTLGDLKRLQELRYSQNATSLWDDFVKLPYKKTNLWLKFAASLDQMKINGSANLKFETQPKKTLTDFSTNYPCLDVLKGVNVVGKNEGSKYFIFQKDANGNKYKFYWPILTQDKGMVFLSKSTGYYNKPNNVFNTSSDIDTGFKWSCSGGGGIGRSQVIIENKMGNLLEGNWTLPTKKKDTEVKTKVNTGGQQGTKSKYQLCTGTYKKGCKDNEGIISKVQGCLGLGVDGKFGPKTEEVIYSKLNRNSFTKSDVDTLCKTGQISEPEIVEPKLIEPEVVKLTDLENI